MHEIDAGEELIRGIDAVEMLAGNAHELRQSGASGDKDGVVTFFAHQFVDGDGAADNDIGFKLNTHGAHVIHLLTDDGFR